ncbi:MAG TPA: SDR family oxidoreductase [Kofleriaceae bacterium]|nr:SDR family oxidoreductase [Kofleriaceae bacterium]
MNEASSGAPAGGSLAGRHVVVTGGHGALGQGVCAVLEARGAVLHVSPDPPALRLDDEAQATAFFAALPSIWASIHLVGGFAIKPITETSLTDFEQQWRINTVTCFLSCREAVRAMRRTGAGGRIVNVAARPVLAPGPNLSAYLAAKAGVAALTQGLAAEVLAEGILVNAVLPSLIDTPANRAAMPDADHASWPRPAQIAEAIAYLASPDNALTSGALLPVYGRA